MCTTGLRLFLIYRKNVIVIPYNLIQMPIFHEKILMTSQSHYKRSKCGKGLIWPLKSKFFKSIENKVKMCQKASKILKQIILLKTIARLWKYGFSKVGEIEHFCKIPYKMPILCCILA